MSIKLYVCSRRLPSPSSTAKRSRPSELHPFIQYAASRIRTLLSPCSVASIPLISSV